MQRTQDFTQHQFVFTRHHTYNLCDPLDLNDANSRGNPAEHGVAGDFT